MGSAKAEVGAKAEGKVGIGFSLKLDFVRVFKDLFVEVGGGPAQGNAAIGRHAVGADWRFLWADAPDLGQGHEDPEEFLGGEDDLSGIVAEQVEVFGVLAEMVDDGRDEVNDGIASSGEGQVGKAEHFIAGEGAVLKGGAMEGREKIITGIFGGVIEGLVEVVIELRSLAVFVVENMDAPGAVGFGFRLRHVEQVGEGVRLDGKGEVADDFDFGSGERGLDES